MFTLAQTSALAGIDYAIIGLYLVGILLIGTYFGRYVKTGRDFFLAGRALPFRAIGMSIVVSDIGAMDFVATAGGGYQFGLAQANYDWLGSMPAILIAAFIFIPYYWRAGVYTIPEFLGRRYNTAIRLIQAVLWLINLGINLAVMLWVTAVLMNEVLALDHRTAIWGTTAIVGVYTISGGLAAVVITDAIQLAIMFVGGAALVVLSVWRVAEVGGLSTAIEALGPAYQQHLQLLLPHDTPTPFPWTGVVLGLGVVLSTAYYIGNQAIVQRCLGARSEWDAKAGMLFAGFLKLFIPLLVVLPGLAALALKSDLPKGDEAIPWLIANILPPGLKGLMFAAFFAALMSSVDSYLNSCSTVFIQDIYRTLLDRVGRPVSSRHQLVVGRIVTAILIVAAAVGAPYIANVTSIYQFIQTLFSFFQGPTLAILLLGMLWARTTQWGALAGLIGGVTLATTFHLYRDAIFIWDEPVLFIAWWTFVAALLVTAVVSLLTPPEPPEQIRGLVYGQVMRDDEVQRALRDRMRDAGPTA